MSYFKQFLSAILAGVLFAVAAIARIESDSSKIVSAVVFGVCILAILTLKLGFADGKIGYVFSNPKKTSENLSIFSIVFLGNLVSVAALGLAFSSVYGDAAEAIVKGYASVTYIEILIKSLFCGALLFVSAHCYHRLVGSSVGSTIAVLSAATVIYCGFIHSISATFYLFASLSFNIRSILYIVISVVGNILGGLLFSLLYEAKKEDKDDSSHHRRHHHRHHSEEESEE